MRLPMKILSGATVLAALAFAACSGDDDDATPTVPALPSASVTATAATQEASPTATATTPRATNTPVPTNPLLRDPRYYAFEVSEGDTVLSITNVINGQPGTAKAGLPGQIADLNGLGTGSFDTPLTPGRQLVVPLVLPGDLAMIPEDGIEQSIGVGGAAGKLVLMQPSLDLRAGYNGKLVLAGLKVSDGKPASEGYGYITRYAVTDRPVMKGGERDPEATIADDAFTVAGGSLVPVLKARAQAGGMQTAEITRDGVTYMVAAGRAAQLTPDKIAAMLQTKFER